MLNNHSGQAEVSSAEVKAGVSSDVAVEAANDAMFDAVADMPTAAAHVVAGVSDREAGAAVSMQAMDDEAYWVQEAEKRPEPASFEEMVRRASTLIDHNPSYRRVFLKIIAECTNVVRPLSDLERFVAAQPGYDKLKQPPYFPIEWLHQAFALEELYLDAQGALHAQADVAPLSEDEFDDLVATCAYRTTDVGLRVAERFDVSCGLSELLRVEADRCDIYVELLGFLREKRNFSQIEGLLRGRPELKETARDGVELQPSMFVDKLEAIGAIEFDGGWQTTAEGRELLDSLN